MRLATGLIAWGTALGLVIGPLVAPLAAQAPVPSPGETSTPVMPSPGETSTLALPPPVEGPSSAAKAGAVAVNIFRVPGKTILCGVGSIIGVGLMLMTGGTQYRAAGAVVREGCGGKWIIGPDDLHRDVDAPRAIFSGETH